MRNVRTLITIVSIAALSGCASTTWNNYSGGTVKSSEVKYNYTAQPVLAEPAGKTYRIEGGLEGLSAVPALESRGVAKSGSGGDVVLAVSAGPIKHEPGGMGFGDKYRPAQISSMPIEILVKDARGGVIMKRNLKHEEILTVRGGATFKTRAEAKAAMTSISEVAKTGAENKLRAGAARAVQKRLESISKELFEPREVNVALPAIRSAGDVDMESAYTLLSEAEGREQVERALDAYQSLGTEHQKADGTADVVGAYGVLCGLASAKILGGDLRGAWQDTKRAWETMPEGKEHRKIAQVLHQQQQQAGVEIIPKEELDQMAQADRAAAMNQLKSLFK